MKLKIKVLVKEGGALPQIIAKGDWIDLALAEDVELKGPYAKTLKWKTREGEVRERYRNVVYDSTIARLGVCIEMPDGFEAPLLTRSSTFRDYGIMQVTGESIIDNSYKSDKDEWKIPMLATRYVKIPKGTRIAQFRIQLSQKATVWQKLKWLFTSSIEIVEVKALNNPPREGFGSTNNVKTQESQNV